MSKEVFCDPIWSREFDDPIEIDGETLRTLRDAGEFIAGLPSAVLAEPHWQLAVVQLIDAAENRNLILHARIALLRALRHGIPDPVRKRRARVHRHW